MDSAVVSACGRPARTGSSIGRWRARLAAALLAVAGLQGGPALADIWAYVDERGVAHFSAQPLDERYALFFRGDGSFSVGGPALPGHSAGGTAPEAPAGVSGVAGKAPPPAGLLAFFEVSPDYKAVKHLLREASAAHGIDYALLQALIATESGFDRHAVSPKGAVGLMQLMPPTAARYGVKADRHTPIEKKLTDARVNIAAGSRYLRDLLSRFPGQPELALAAYNAGEGAVQRAGNRIPNYPETRNYVRTVMQLYHHLKPVHLPVRPSGVTGGRVRLEMMGGGASRASLPTAPTRPPAGSAALETHP